ncbi:MAG TPA: ABC transporter permease [Magnetospirillaceae bacterium]|jgi:peptide/nickel transport system permease protein
MVRLIAGRLAAAVPNLIGVIVITFILTHLLPGDPAAYFAGPSATAASVEETRHRLGLDHSLIEQFALYVKGLAQGDLGNSLISGQPVLADLINRLPASFELTFGALLLAVVIGIPLGMQAALHPGSWIDRLCNAISTLGQAMPTFFLGLLLVFVFYYLLGWAPAPLGRLDSMFEPPPTVTTFWTIDSLLVGDLSLFWAVFSQLILPVVTLGLFGVGPLARMTRASLLEVLSSDYVRTARAAGLPRHQVLWTYAFRNALVPVLNTAGMVFSFLLGANVLVEKVFGWPGIGAYAIEALLASDFAPVQGFVIVMALFYVLVNLTIDVVTVLVDPRVAFDA